MSDDKKVTDFCQGDRVEFTCRGYVTRVSYRWVYVKLDGLLLDVAARPGTLVNLSEAREMTAEEAEELNGFTDDDGC